MRREMPDLIDRTWVLKNLFFDVDKEVVRKAPAVDSVEVVRCKECRLWDRISEKVGKCPFYIGKDQFTRYDHYCSCGRSKGNAAD